MTIGKQRDANRRNAQRSADSRTAAGRRRVGLKAISHSLSVPLDPNAKRDLVDRLRELLAVECESAVDAESLAMRISEYEWTVAHRRLLMLEQSDQDTSPTEDRPSSRDEVLLMASIDEMLGEAPDPDQITRADRYHRRAANQLIKVVRAL